jgi:hypothetical protein
MEYLQFCYFISGSFSLLDVLIGIGCVYVFIDVGVHTCMSICIYTVFLKKPYFQ